MILANKFELISLARNNGVTLPNLSHTRNGFKIMQVFATRREAEQFIDDFKQKMNKSGRVQTYETEIKTLHTGRKSLTFVFKYLW